MFQKLGKFDIKRVLGNGAMGEVYLGTDPAIGRDVAIKTILPSAAGGPESKERFAREAKAAGVLNHPNLVTIYEFGEDQGVMYIAMELVRGHDLEELLRDQSLTRSELLEVLAQVCDGLDYAHRQHIVHRDIKPSNVRVSQDGKKQHAKVMDFGVARVGNSDMTATGMVMGTVSYMAPEYIRTGKPDPRSDLFAVGVMLYEGLSGRKPFSGDTTPTILYKIVNEPPEPIDLSQLQGISPAIRSVLDNALSKDPDQRYQTAEDFAKALRSAKDPTWQGQVLGTAPDRTVQLASAPTAPAPIPGPQATVQLSPTRPEAVPAVASPSIPAASMAPPPAKSGSKGPLLAAAAAVVLVAGGLGAWKFMGAKAEPAAPSTATASPNPNPAPTQPSTSNPEPAKPTAPVTPGIQPPASPLPVKAEPLKPEAKGREIHVVEASRQQVKVETSTDPKAAKDLHAKVEEEVMRNLSAPERMSRSLTTLSEATSLADSSPDKAMAGIHRAIALNPGNANAYAWGIAIAYRNGRFAECKQLFRQARREGVAHQLATNVRFRQVMADERFQKRIPGGLGVDE